MGITFLTNDHYHDFSVYSLEVEQLQAQLGSRGFSFERDLAVPLDDDSTTHWKREPHT